MILLMISIFLFYNKCAIPVFDGLLPKRHDQIIRRLLFEFATWHGLAKLRLHTETTVVDLENSTTRLGKLLRLFESDVFCSLSNSRLTFRRSSSRTTAGSWGGKENSRKPSTTCSQAYRAESSSTIQT